MRGFVLIAVTPLLLAADRGLPTDVDLRAAFCVGYYKDAVPVDAGAFPPEFRPKIEETNREVAEAAERLRAYLGPKISYLDSEAMLTAIAQGDRYKKSLVDPASICKDQQSEQCKRFIKVANDCRTTPFLPF